MNLNLLNFEKHLLLTQPRCTIGRRKKLVPREDENLIKSRPFSCSLFYPASTYLCTLEWKRISMVYEQMRKISCSIDPKSFLPMKTFLDVISVELHQEISIWITVCLLLSKDSWKMEIFKGHSNKFLIEWMIILRKLPTAVKTQIRSRAVRGYRNSSSHSSVIWIQAFFITNPDDCKHSKMIWIEILSASVINLEN